MTSTQQTVNKDTYRRLYHWIVRSLCWLECDFADITVVSPAPFQSWINYWHRLTRVVINYILQYNTVGLLLVLV